jgi:glycosyltransferase involved in cell wall biosynthesis
MIHNSRALSLKKRKIPISVVIPAYNRAVMLGRALQSVDRQSVQCEEILVVDDGSTDGSRELVESMVFGEPGLELRWLRHACNLGPAAARNLAIAHARCPMIAFLDSDDHWLPKKLEKQAALMELHPDYLISHTRERWLRGGRHLNQKKRHRPRHGDIFPHCLELCAVGMSTVMLRRDIFSRVGLFEESMRCCEDYDLWLRVSCRLPFLLVDEVLTVKEGGREDQVSSQYRVGMDRFRIESLLRLLDSGVLSRSQEKLAKEELRKKCMIYGNGCLKYGKETEGRYILGLAMTAGSGDPPPEIDRRL